MQTLFILVKCELGRAYELAEHAVDRLEEVSEVYSISGEYDVLLKCYLPEGHDIGRFVTQKVQTLPGVANTFTMLAFKAFT